MMHVTTILVEDSSIIRETLVPALEELTNIRVAVMVATVDEAIAALHLLHDRWRLIVVDLFLAEGSGLDVLKAVQNRSDDQYAFVLSNYPTPDMTRRCLELGATAVFDKSKELDAFFDRCMEIDP